LADWLHTKRKPNKNQKTDSIIAGKIVNKYLDLPVSADKKTHPIGVIYNSNIYVNDHLQIRFHAEW
jgi:hypothetical protein